MKVFISWSGERSLALAEALKTWLPLVLHYVEPWLSKSDIDAGRRWDDELTKTLNECNFGISCITPDNITAPWLLFEAGALAKSVEEGKLVPLLYGMDVKDFTGPLSRFQAKKVDRQGIEELVQSINRASPASVPEQRLADLFELAWDKLDQKLEAIPASTVPAKRVRNQNDILEDLVSSVRSVESRVRDFSDEEPGYRRSRRSKMHPAMVFEVLSALDRTSDNANKLLVIGSFFKDDAPWLYELARAAHDEAASGSGFNDGSAIEALKRASDLILMGPFSRAMTLDREAQHFLLDRLRDCIDELARGYASPRLRRRTRVIETLADAKLPEVEKSDDELLG